ncbi:unnamed protein product [Chrysoparadoxa australica]
MKRKAKVKGATRKVQRGPSKEPPPEAVARSSKKRKRPEDVSSQANGNRSMKEGKQKTGGAAPIANGLKKRSQSAKVNEAQDARHAKKAKVVVRAGSKELKQERARPKRANDLNEAMKMQKAKQQEQKLAGTGQAKGRGVRSKGGKKGGDKELSEEEKTKYVAMDCEMVGVGPNGSRSVLAHCCIVNYEGEVVYNKHVKAVERVTDFRTFVSGVKPAHLKHQEAIPFAQCQREVAAILKDRILIGHALKNDLKALLLSHSYAMMRDTATYRPFKSGHGRGGKLRPRSLKKLCAEFLAKEVQTGQHDPAEDARGALMLYKLKRKEWERSLIEGKRFARPVDQARKAKKATRE